MITIDEQELIKLLRGAYAEGWNNRSDVPEHKTFEVDAMEMWHRSLTRKDFLIRSSSVTRHEIPKPIRGPGLLRKIHESLRRSGRRTAG